MEVKILANIKSAKKRILVNRTKADRNKAIKSGVKILSRRYTQLLKLVIRAQHSLLFSLPHLLLIRQQPKVYITKIQHPEKCPVFPKL